MISKKLFSELNKQTNYEFYSEYVYLGMVSYFEAEDLKGFSNFFRVQMQEEHFHAYRFFDYINTMNGKVTLEAMDKPSCEFESVVDALKKTLIHEQGVTSRIYNLVDIATSEKEHATISFLKWFIDEQVEEENTVTNILKKLERIGDDKAALYMLDDELALRVFTTPVIA